MPVAAFHPTQLCRHWRGGSGTVRKTEVVLPQDPIRRPMHACYRVANAQMNWVSRRAGQIEPRQRGGQGRGGGRGGHSHLAVGSKSSQGLLLKGVVRNPLMFVGRRLPASRHNMKYRLTTHAPHISSSYTKRFSRIAQPDLSTMITNPTSDVYSSEPKDWENLRSCRFGAGRELFKPNARWATPCEAVRFESIYLGSGHSTGW
jgi:hypothetical protein